MRANVARQARRLLVRHATLPSCAVYATPARRRPMPRQITSRRFQRTFFGSLFQTPPREVRHPEYEPGWMDIMVWRSRTMDNLRPAPPNELLESFRKLLQSKQRTRTAFTSTQALQCRRLLRHLQREGQGVASADLSMASMILQNFEKGECDSGLDSHRLFAKEIYDTWVSGDYTGTQQPPELQWSYLIRAMAKYDRPQEALSMLYENWDDPAYSTMRGEIVEAVAQGLARDGHEKELVELVEYAENHDVPFDARIQSVVTTFFAGRDQVAETQHWFAKPVASRDGIDQVYRTVASFALRNNLQDWAVLQFIQLSESPQSKKVCDVLLQCFLLLGKDLEEVNVMASRMLDSNGKFSPDIKTINGLLRVALETKDLELAAKLLALGAERRLAPDGETFIVMLALHIELGDLASCRGPYEQVQYFEPWINESDLKLPDEYRLLVNKYLLALCRQTPPDYKLLATVLLSVEEQQLRLEPWAVDALCLRFLENDQHFDVMDLLSMHSFMYSETERKMVQNAFMSFCVDPNTSTSRSWAAYQLLHQFFQDTSFKRRVQLMETFFDRKRPDMAVQVFGHMRQHRNKSMHPTADTYIRCFGGFTRNPDKEGVEMTYNMLKMDTSIVQNTRLLTSVMTAHTACGRTSVALDLWGEITRSQDGPSYSSLEAVFWALEKKSSGSKVARGIWEKMVNMDLEVSPEVYNAYVGAIAGSGHEAEARSLISSMAAVVGSEPDAMTLGVAYNALPGQGLQSRFQDWAKQQYGETWTQLEKKGRRMTEDRLCYFKINRAIKA